MPFRDFRDELIVEDGLVLNDQRIILPQSLHAATLEQIHYAHQCVEKGKFVQRQRSSVLGLLGVTIFTTSLKSQYFYSKQPILGLTHEFCWVRACIGSGVAFETIKLSG